MGPKELLKGYVKSYKELSFLNKLKVYGGGITDDFDVIRDIIKFNPPPKK